MNKRILGRIAAVCLSVAAAGALAGCGEENGGVNSDYASGMQALEDKDYSGALTYFGKASESGGIAAECLRGEGIASFYLGKYDDAVQYFEQALDAVEHPGQNQEFQEDVMFYEAQCYVNLGQQDKAMTLYDRLLKGSHAAEAYLLRGKLYAGMDKFGQAGQDFQHAINLNGSYEYYLQIYDVYVQNNRQADGAAFLKEAQSNEADTPEDNYQLGRISYELKDYDKAEAYLKKAVDGKVQEALVLLGRVYIDDGNADAAAKMYQNCIDDGSAVSVGYNGLALCSMDGGDYDTALSYIQKGLAAEDTTMKEELMYNEIVCYERKLDFDTAADKMKAFLEAFPANSLAARENQFISSRVQEESDAGASAVNGSTADEDDTGADESVTASSYSNTDDTGAELYTDDGQTDSGQYYDDGTGYSDSGYSDDTDYEDYGYADAGQ